MFSPYMATSCAKPVQASGKLNTEFTQRTSEAALSNLLLIKGRPFLCSLVRITSGFSVSLLLSQKGGRVLMFWWKCTGPEAQSSSWINQGKRQHAWESITKAGNKGVFTPEPCLVFGALWSLWPTCLHNDKLICLKSSFLSLQCFDNRRKFHTSAVTQFGPIKKSPSLCWSQTLCFNFLRFYPGQDL